MKIDQDKEKRYIAIQIGARRNYIVPSILQQAGLLETFYTDLCANKGLGGVLERTCPQFLRRGALARLLNRKLPQNLQGRVYTSDLVALRLLIRQKLAGSNPIRQYQALADFNKEFSQGIIEGNLGQSTHVFTMGGEGIDFVEFAYSKGLKCVSEIYIAPHITHKIVQAEKYKFPELEPITSAKILQSDYELISRLCKSTDAFIVPSKFVLKDLLEEFKFPEDRCYLVPYGVNLSWLNVQNMPSKGRILFVGTAEIRKGIHILGMAAEKLRGRNYEFRVAGGVTDAVKGHPLMGNLNFLGRVPRDKIKPEYAQADIFVLPSLAEGSAEVTYEALAAGLPVITTEAAGSVVQDGIEGFIVPERDADRLASRIEELVENRELRDRMAISAKERAKDYTWDKYAERLLSVFNAV